jgi:zinc protease
MFKRLISCLVVILPVWVSAASAREIRVSDRVFLVRDRPGSPLEFQMIVNAGCADEANNQCVGLAHYLEHLIFVGRNPEHANIALRLLPDAMTNGWTNQVATVYWHRMPNRDAGPRADLEKVFNFYAGRLRDFSISGEEAARERNVVLQEYDWRYSSNAVLRHMMRVDRELLPDHPMGQWTIGTRETIQNLTLQQAREFHARWYKRSNVWFVIKGDVDPAMLKEISEKALEGSEPGPVPARPSAFPPKIENRTSDISAEDTKATKRSVHYKKMIQYSAPDRYSVLAQATLLENLLASRLLGSLHDAVSDQSKLSPNAPYVKLSEVTPDVFALTIVADVNEELSPGGRRLLDAITSYVEGLSASTFSDRNIDRIRKRLLEQRKTSDIIPAEVFQRLIGWLAQGYDPDELNRVADRIGAVSDADIGRFLSALAGPGRVVTGILAPKGGDQK